MRRHGGRGRQSRREYNNEHSSYSQATTSSERAPKHPPHLRGRAIGLYYASLNKNKPDEPIGPITTIIISEHLMKSISCTLKGLPLRNIPDGSSKSYSHIKDSHFKNAFLRTIQQTLAEKISETPACLNQDPKLDNMLYEEYKDKCQSYKFKEMEKFRKKLPSYNMRDTIVDTIEQNQIVVISGETGCGKTTQVAQFILDDYLINRKGSMCHVLCTQPRRISAISVAERVANERDDILGASVGYHIRLEHKLPRTRGSIVFCTTGIVLKKMETDPCLSEISHLILDEIHERDVLSDFILALIKRIIVQRRDLKIILMSATLNSEKFSSFYGNCPHLNIPGFTYPVEEYYLEDILELTRFNNFEVNRRQKPKPCDDKFSSVVLPYVNDLESQRKYSRQVLNNLSNPLSEEINLELIFELIHYICEKNKDDGAILVFLTGYTEISALCSLLENSGRFPKSKYRIAPLHSIMPTVDQKAIFETPPPGVRKIVVATNIAETSITIDDVVHVIDCGKIKLSNFDHETNSQTLNAEWVSMANAKQRKGRAGRVKPGVCYHLFTRARNMVLELYQLPEILRKRLDDVILVAKVLQLGKIEDFFEQLLDQPDPQAVKLSLELLQRLDALDDDENLTPLGYHLAKLPMAPQMGKMILFGAMFSCIDPILSIAATLDFKDPFQMPIGKQQEADERKRDLANDLMSDHLLAHQVLSEYEKLDPHSRSKFCWRNFLSPYTCRQLIGMRGQFMSYLFDMSFVSSSDPHDISSNRNSNNIGLVKGIVAAALYPNVLVSHIPGKAPLRSPFNLSAKYKFHPKSILANERLFGSRLLVYYIKVKTAKDYIHDATLVDTLPIIFFGDRFALESPQLITINKLLQFKCTQITGQVLTELRFRFDWFLTYKISHPGSVSWEANRQQENYILDVMKKLITCEDMGDGECVNFQNA